MSRASAEKIRVLFVEDAVDHALLVQTFFRSAPEFAVTHTQDGDQALELLERRAWDLLVADLNVPGADGFAVIRAARAGGRHLPILATTGYTQEHYWDQAFRAGADQVMVKPLDRDEFLSRVRTLVGAKEPADTRRPRGARSASAPETRPRAELPGRGKSAGRSEGSGTPGAGGRDRGARHGAGGERGELDSRRGGGPRGRAAALPEAARRRGAKDTVVIAEGLLGDGVMGCGGTALLMARSGARVLVLPLLADPDRIDASELEAAKDAARLLGIGFKVADVLVSAPGRTTEVLDRVIGELRPSTVYAPARGDAHPARAAATRAVLEAARGRAHVLGYQTATSAMGFAPDRLVDVSATLAPKVEALGAFRPLVATRRELDPELARAYARYWGRFEDFSEVEAFELIQENA